MYAYAHGHLIIHWERSYRIHSLYSEHNAHVITLCVPTCRNACVQLRWPTRVLTPNTSTATIVPPPTVRPTHIYRCKLITNAISTAIMTWNGSRLGVSDHQMYMQLIWELWITRSSERKHSWPAMITPIWPQFPALQRFKDPHFHCTCVWHPNYHWTCLWHFLIAKENNNHVKLNSITWTI